MTINQTERLLKVLRAYGVSHFKSQTIEIRIEVLTPSLPLTSVGPTSSGESIAKVPPTAAAAPPVQMEIPHHVNEVAKLLKLNDEQLVDALFPEGAPPRNE